MEKISSKVPNDFPQKVKNNSTSPINFKLNPSFSRDHALLMRRESVITKWISPWPVLERQFGIFNNLLHKSQNEPPPQAGYRAGQGLE